MMFCWNCESEFNSRQVKVRKTPSVLRDGSSPYNDNERCNDFLCPYCGSSDIEEVVDEYLIKDSDDEEIDYFGTEEEAWAALKGYEAEYREKLSIVRVLTGVTTGESIEQEV